MDQDRVMLFKTAERIKEELIKASRVLPQDVQALIDKVNPEMNKNKQSPIAPPVAKNFRLSGYNISA